MYFTGIQYINSLYYTHIIKFHVWPRTRFFAHHFLLILTIYLKYFQNRSLKHIIFITCTFTVVYLRCVRFSFFVVNKCGNKCKSFYVYMIPVICIITYLFTFNTYSTYMYRADLKINFNIGISAVWTCVNQILNIEQTRSKNI